MLRVQLFQGHQQLFHGAAAQVVLPGADGDVAVLDCHAPMLCTLLEGYVQIDEARFPIRKGLARVDRNAITILAV